MVAKRWLVLGNTHDTREAAEAQAAAIRERHYPSAIVIDTDHYANMVPGRFAVVFWAVRTKDEAARRSQGIWNLGHRSWIRWSGEWVPSPTAASLRKRRERLDRQRREEKARYRDEECRKGKEGADASSPCKAK